MIFLNVNFEFIHMRMLMKRCDCEMQYIQPVLGQYGVGVILPSYNSSFQGLQVSWCELTLVI